MTINDGKRQRLAMLARAGSTVSAVAFGLALAGALTPGVTPAAAAVARGVAEIITPVADGGTPLTGGDGGTAFSLKLPDGAACSGDGEAAYRVHSYMIAWNEDPALLEFDSVGPIPQAFGSPLSEFRAPLYDTFGTPFASAFPAPAVPAGGPGTVVNIPTFNHLPLWTDVDRTLLPAGQYNIGIACWGPVGADPVLDKLWNARITITTDPADPTGPGLDWTAEAPLPTTTVTLVADPADESAEGDDVTLTASIAPAAAAGTITFRDGNEILGTPVALAAGEASVDLDDLERGERSLRATYTPAAAAAFAPSTSATLEYTVLPPGSGSSTTSTTSGSGSTTSTTRVGGTSTTTSTTTAGGATSSTTSTTLARGAGPSTGQRAGSLAVTGLSFSVLVWGLLALVLGRMAVLLSRPTKVRTS